MKTSTNDFRSSLSLIVGEMATSAASGDDGSKKGGGEERYECNICFEQATDAVVSMCGHLFW